MPIPETWISIDHLQGALATFLVLAATSLVDYVVNALFDRKIFEPAWEWAKRKFKAWRTKRDKITADYEFSIYLDSNLPPDKTREAASELLKEADRESDGDLNIEEQKWSDDGLEQDVSVTYKNRREPFDLTLNFVPDGSPGREMRPGQDGEYNPQIASIGVNIRFRFAFGDLKGSIIDLMLFAGFLRDAAEDLLSVRSITDGRFVVSLVESDLTLDDWIKKEQFDVSLLLKSDDSRSSVEFYSDQAVISSPHTAVDDKTVEYIRAALLNYYL